MKRPALNLEHFDKFFMPREEGKHQNESLTETSRMIFFAVHWSDTTYNCLMASWNKRVV